MKRAIVAGCFTAAMLLSGTGLVWAEGEQVPVGGYLYARPADLDKATGGMTVHFATAGKRLVIAYGRQNRKDRLSRGSLTDAEKEWVKPFKADLSDGGKTAVFPHLPPDFYDLIVIETDTMRLYEGIDLLTEDMPDLSGGTALDQVKKSLARPTGKLSGWEGFFDAKNFERLETDGVRGAVLLQQMRLGTALAESGAQIPGCIHSIDVVWLVKGKTDEAGWQVTQRQQLFREELPKREFFHHAFKPELQGVRVGVKMKDVGTILQSGEA